MSDDRQIVAGVLLWVEGLRVRLATDTGHVEVELDAPPQDARLGSFVRVFGAVKLCDEWIRPSLAVVTW